MAPVNLKLKVLVDAKELSALPDVVKKANAKVEGENKASAAKVLAEVDKAEKERIAIQNRYSALEMSFRKKQSAAQTAEEERRSTQRISLQRASIALQEKLEGQKAAETARAAAAIEAQRIARQRASIALEERMERERGAAQTLASVNALRETKSQADATLRIERQAAIANASLVLDKFDRRIAIENIKHTQIVLDLKGNHAAIEAETRRHQAVVGRIRMDQGNFANTPFQKMLENFNKLNTGISKMGPVMTTAAGQIGQMSSTIGAASAAANAFGGALSSLAMGPIGIAIAAATALSFGLNKIIDAADRAANIKGDQGSTIKDPEKLKAAIDAAQRYEEAKAKIASGPVAARMGGMVTPEVLALNKANSDFRAIMGERLSDSVVWDLARLKQQEAFNTKSLAGHEKYTTNYKQLEREFQSSLNASIKDDTARALADEDLRWKTQTAEMKKGSASLELANKIHIQNRSRILAGGAESQYEERVKANEVQRELRFQQALAQAKKQHKDAVARQAEEEDVRRTNAAYARQTVEAKKFARDARIGAMGPGSGRANEESRAREQDELAAFNLSQEAKTLSFEEAEITRANIAKKYRLEREAADKEASDLKIQREKNENSQRLSATAGFFGGFAALAAQANMKDRAARLRWKTLAIAEATANTSLAATKALSAAPPPFNFALMAGVVAAGLAQVNSIKEQRFARGTDYAPGGMALVGEEGPEMVYLPRGSQVKTASETRKLGGGGGGITHTGNVVIQITPPPGSTPSQVGEMTRSASIAWQEELKRHARLTAEVAYYGVTA